MLCKSHFVAFNSDSEIINHTAISAQPKLNQIVTIIDMSNKPVLRRQSRYRFNVIRCPESLDVPAYVPVGSYADQLNPPLCPAPEPEKVEEPKGNSYADIMTSKPKSILKKSKVTFEAENKGDPEVSALCSTMSAMEMSAALPKSRRSPSKIESIHAPKKTQMSDDKKFPTTPKTDEKTVSTHKADEKSVASPQKSVLFAPAEVRVNKMYGGWKGLKGDPEKLERLNQPATKPLESRWAT